MCRGVDVLPQVLRDARADQRLQRVQPIGAQPVQRPVEGGEVDPVDRVRAPRRRAARPSPASPSPAPRSGARTRPTAAAPGPGGRRTARGTSPRRSPWPSAARPARAAAPARRAAISGVDRVRAEEPGQRRPAGAQLVVRLGVVGRPPRRARRPAAARPRTAGSAGSSPRRIRARSARRGPRTAAPSGRRRPVPCRGPAPSPPARAPTGRSRWSAPAAGSAARASAARSASARSSAVGVASRCPEASTTASTRSVRPSRSCTSCASPSSVSPVATVRCSCTRIPGGQRGDHVPQHPGQVGALQPPAGEGRRGDRAQLGGQLRAERRPDRRARASRCAQSQNDGPGRIGPAQTTESSVYMVTSAAIEFMASSGDWSCRQIRPAPAGYGSIEVHGQRAAVQLGSAGRQPFQRCPTPRGPAPTIAIAAVMSPLRDAGPTGGRRTRAPRPR